MSYNIASSEAVRVYRDGAARRVAFSRSSTKRQFEERAQDRPIARRPRPLIDTDFTTPPPLKKVSSGPFSSSRDFVPCRPIRVCQLGTPFVARLQLSIQIAKQYSLGSNDPIQI